MIAHNLAPVVDGHVLYPGIDFELEPGKITVVIGHSGIGKTSLFNAITGDITHSGLVESLDVHMRVFQGSGQLLPWFTVEENLDLISAKQKNYNDLVKNWNLDQHLSNYPYQLSVGQRQRFVLIGAIFSGRKLLLCDEPLSGVDGITALRISRDFRQAVQDNQIKCMWITHDLIEAESIADQVILLDRENPEVVSHCITYHELYKKFT